MSNLKGEYSQSLNHGETQNTVSKSSCRVVSVLLVLVSAVAVIFGVALHRNHVNVFGTSNHGISAKEHAKIVALTELSTDLSAAMDTSVDPCDDFFAYSCNGWLDHNPIPPTDARVGSFGDLGESNQMFLRGALNDLAKEVDHNPAKRADPVGQTLMYYQSCMKRSVGHKQFGAVRAQMAALNAEKFAKRMKLANQLGTSPLFSLSVGQDDKHSDVNVLHFSQAGLGMPDASYYNKTGKFLPAYRDFAHQVMTRANVDGGALLANQAIDFETQLSAIFQPASALRDPIKTYNPMSLTEFADKFANKKCNLDWMSVFQAFWPEYATKATVGEDGKQSALGDVRVIVQDTAYPKALSKLLCEVDDSIVGAYVQWRFLVSVVKDLDSEMSELWYSFNKVLTGTPKPPPLWKQCISSTDGAWGMALGSLFVAGKFESAEKGIAEQMITDVKQSFIDNLPNLSWMDATTRRRAADKARAVRDFIGYPDYIMDPAKLAEHYKDMKPMTTNMYTNVLLVRARSLAQNLGDLYKAVDKTKWQMTPDTVNAYYTPTSNSIFFPAGILQKPFFQGEFPVSANYGAMGSVMGHELTHGFDDQGSQYDLNGNLKKWWTPYARSNFIKVAQCIVDQYSDYKIPSGQHVNGVLTEGENLADNGGVSASFRAYRAAAKRQGLDPAAKPLKSVGDVDLNHDKLFFTSWARVWCGKYRPLFAEKALKTDPHSPVRWRVIGPLRNSPEFQKAFQCKATDPMVPKKRCKVW